jgi:putative glycosyltransferase (TIGR04348 family)
VPQQRLVIVTPTLAKANTGNWQTASRWARLLSGSFRVRVTDHWAGGDEQLMIALHARKSAAAMQAWRTCHPCRPLVLVLTGTDIYGQIDTDATMHRSLEQADRIVVLNRRALAAMPPPFHAKAVLCLPSCPSRQALHKTARHLRVLMVGHLREEKSPRIFFEAVRLLQHRNDMRFDHVGAALDPALGDEARRLAQECAQYRWLGPLPHGKTRAKIQAAHVLVHPSRQEGGATVIVEAVRSGTPVIASRVEGNIGLLGEDYGGYVAWGDAQALADAISRARDEPGYLDQLQGQCTLLAPQFTPAQERASLLSLLEPMLGAHAPPSQA